MRNVIIASAICALICTTASPAYAVGKGAIRRNVRGMVHVTAHPHVTDRFLFNASRIALLRMRFQGTPPTLDATSPSSLTTSAAARRRSQSARSATSVIPRGVSGRGSAIIHSQVQVLAVQHQANLEFALTKTLGAAGRRVASSMRRSMSAQAQATPVTEVQFVAYGATEEDSTLFTRVYYFIYDSATGVLKAYGNRLATPAEANASHLPVNPIQ